MFASILLGTSFLKAQTIPDIPHLISYQGILENATGKPVADGTHQLLIRLYTRQSGEIPVWEEDDAVQTNGGVFNILLGENQPVPEAIASVGPLWLGVSVDGGPELPRSELTASPYALTVADGAITAQKMAVPFVGSLSVNGDPVSTKGGNVNFMGTNGISLQVDPTTNAILIGTSATGTIGSGKGKLPLSNTVKSITGTQDQILANNSYGTKESDDVTLTLPQNINSGASPSFAGLTLSGKATSAATASGDASGTLTTKGYVDNGLSTETSAREASDDSLRTNVSNEISTRTSQASTYLLLDGTRSMNGVLDMSSNGISNVADPVNAQDAATKNYVDNSAASLQASLNAEAASRAAGDSTLTVNLQHEVSRSGGAETNLQSNITAESVQREASDSVISTNLSNEITTRTNQALTYPLLDGTRSMTGALNMGSHAIHAIADPTNATDAATKNYVDTSLAGLSRNVIHNGNSQQTANFNISGNGTLGGNLSMSGGSILDAGITGTTPASGAGGRMEWIPAKVAFRAGYASSTQWDDANIGYYSLATGNSTLATGPYSVALGSYTIASSANTFAEGAYDTAINTGSVAMGYGTLASGYSSVGLGYYCMASGPITTAFGRIATASGTYATALGNYVTASGNMATAIGSQTIASGTDATAIGNTTTASGANSTALGNTTTASGANSTAMGQHASTNSHQGAFVYGDNSTSSNILANADNEFDVRASGGVNLFTKTDLSTGVSLPANGGLHILGGGLSSDGSMAFSGALMPDSSAGTSGQVLASAGAGNAPTWISTAHLVSVPSSSSASGNPGDIAYDSSYLYICVAANTWERIALSTW